MALQERGILLDKTISLLKQASTDTEKLDVMRTAKAGDTTSNMPYTVQNISDLLVDVEDKGLCLRLHLLAQLWETHISIVDVSHKRLGIQGVICLRERALMMNTANTLSVWTKVVYNGCESVWGKMYGKSF